MKKFLLLLVLLLAVACGGPEAPATEATDTGESETAVSTTDPATDAATEDTPPTAVERPSSPPPTDFTPAGNPVEASEVRDFDHIKGAADPTVTIIEYGDYQCPGCAGIAPVFEHLVDAYPNDVQLVFRHFPLTQIHDNAQKAAESAELANAQGAFWQYHTALYENQADWVNLSASKVRDYFISLAEEMGLDTAQFAADYDNGIFASYVSGLEQEAIGLGLPGTPAVLLDGQLIAGQNLPFDVTIWSDFIDAQIQVKALADRQYDEAPPMTIDPDKSYFAHFLMENGDEFTIELLPKSAPVTVNSFVFLAKEGWYDGVTFHRVLEGFMAQTGDPTGTGVGGPGYTIDDEIDPALTHGEAGVVSMANSGPNTSGSQFFITFGDSSNLDGSYSIFGKVIEGMDAVQNITLRDPNDPNAPDGDMIVSVTIEEK